MAVFRVTSDFKTIVNPEAAKLVPELKTLTEDELLFCILVVDDVDGPFRKKPLDERIEMAKTRYPDVKSDSAKMKVGMQGYASLVFNRRRRTIDVLQRRYDQISREIETDPDMSSNKLAERLKSQDLLSKRIDALQGELDAEDLAYELKGGKKMSFIEIWQQNKKEYEAYLNEL